MFRGHTLPSPALPEPEGPEQGETGSFVRKLKFSLFSYKSSHLPDRRIRKIRRIGPNPHFPHPPAQNFYTKVSRNDKMRTEYPISKFYLFRTLPAESTRRPKTASCILIFHLSVKWYNAHFLITNTPIGIINIYPHMYHSYSQITRCL